MNVITLSVYIHKYLNAKGIYVHLFHRYQVLEKEKGHWLKIPFKKYNIIHTDNIHTDSCVHSNNRQNEKHTKPFFPLWWSYQTFWNTFICNKYNQYVLHLINYSRLHDTLYNIKFTHDKMKRRHAKKCAWFHTTLKEWEAHDDQINLSGWIKIAFLCINQVENKPLLPREI